ncbi:hypothetical protein MKW98_005431 [Papaver atlanticum]|uniref:Uncharacterized protein n=1 Tax=Papaver atlanticum TaxID=357466 RepID=A0AAD4T325_9MAGN|nr:hypothetical protein MKW98_005431 [Papaver atlanticum]
MMVAPFMMAVAPVLMMNLLKVLNILKSPIREKSLMSEAPSTALKDNSELQMSRKYKQKSLSSEHLPLNSPYESQSKDQTELSMIGKCKLAHATLRNIIALEPATL